MELIADIAFHSTFPEKEIAKERDVIIDEIHAWRDNPGDAIFDEFQSILYPGHALGANILGDEKSVGGFGREDVLRFIERQYRNDRLVFSSVGPMPAKRSSGSPKNTCLPDRPRRQNSSALPLKAMFLSASNQRMLSTRCTR